MCGERINARPEDFVHVDRFGRPHRVGDMDTEYIMRALPHAYKWDKEGAEVKALVAVLTKRAQAMLSRRGRPCNREW